MRRWSKQSRREFAQRCSRVPSRWHAALTREHACWRGPFKADGESGWHYLADARHTDGRPLIVQTPFVLDSAEQGFPMGSWNGLLARTFMYQQSRGLAAGSGARPEYRFRISRAGNSEFFTRLHSVLDGFRAPSSKTKRNVLTEHDDLVLRAPCLIDRPLSKSNVLGRLEKPTAVDDYLPSAWSWATFPRSNVASEAPLLCQQPILDQYGRRLSMADACELQSMCSMAHFFYAMADPRGRFEMRWCGCVIEVPGGVLFQQIRLAFGEEKLARLRTGSTRHDAPSVFSSKLFADLPSDVLGCIAHFLPASDLFTLRQINRRLHRVYEEWLQRTRALSKRITQRLAQLGLSHWPAVLQQTGGVLSGSFVLHALNEPLSAASWTPHDIDVYLLAGLTLKQWTSRAPVLEPLPYWRFLPHPSPEWQFPKLADVAETDKCALAHRRTWRKYEMMSNRAVCVYVDTVTLPRGSQQAHDLSTDFIVMCTVSDAPHENIQADGQPARDKMQPDEAKETAVEKKLLGSHASDDDEDDDDVEQTAEKRPWHDITTRESSADTLSAFLDHTFDLDFIKNTYDGRRVRIMQLAALARRGSESHRSHPQSWEACQRRNFKYRSRGFAIEPFYVEEMRRALGEPPSLTDVAVEWTLWNT